MTVSVSMKPAKDRTETLRQEADPLRQRPAGGLQGLRVPAAGTSPGLIPDGTLVNSALQSERQAASSQAGNKWWSTKETTPGYAENQVGKDEMHVHITVVTAAPRIRPPRQTYGKVKPGGNIRFDCEAVGEPKPKILWMLPNNDVIAASNERYLMHVNGSLEIRDVKLMDAGQYVCIARNPAGENRKLYRLELDGNPPVINGYRQNRTVIKDTAVKYSRKFIDCMAEGQPTPSITWIMPDNIFLKAPYFGSRINVHRNGTLEIRNVRPSDTAEFICMARNEGGEAVMVMQLEVTSMLRRPIFRNPFNERIVTRLGKTAVLNCSAGGHPAPEMIWTLPNGTRFTGGPDRGYRHHLGSDGTFIIYSPVKADSGKYRCAAKNSVGYIEKLILLEVGQKPYILSRPRGIIRTVFSGTLSSSTAWLTASPRPSVSWTVPGGHILTRPQVLDATSCWMNAGPGTLIIQRPTVSDSGAYKCIAKNHMGKDSKLTIFQSQLVPKRQFGHELGRLHYPSVQLNDNIGPQRRLFIIYYCPHLRSFPFQGQTLTQCFRELDPVDLGFLHIRGQHCNSEAENVCIQTSEVATSALRRVTLLFSSSSAAVSVRFSMAEGLWTVQDRLPTLWKWSVRFICIEPMGAMKSLGSTGVKSPGSTVMLLRLRCGLIQGWAQVKASPGSCEMERLG
ncbi:hypothetical protein CRUP_027689 [Coryphaenoides rupestris]|nr:hypothetical protein CRUP_027689 [Coryphaenoides rupestris]